MHEIDRLSGSGLEPTFGPGTSDVRAGTSRSLSSAMAGYETSSRSLEEVEDLIESGPGRCSFAVVEMLGQHRVGVLRVSVGIALRRIELDGDEAVAQFPTQASRNARRNRKGRWRTAGPSDTLRRPPGP